MPGRRKPSTPMPSGSPAPASAPNRYWPDDRSQCSRYEGTPARSSLTMSVARPATGARSAAPSGAISSCRSAPHSRASRSAASGPVIRISARPWVRSVTLANSSGAASAASVVSHPATCAAVPGGASTSHSPGPEPTTSQPWFRGGAGGSSPPELAESRPARPNGTPSALAAPPFHGAFSWTLASGVQSVMVSGASLRHPLTSQPACTKMGGTGAIGLRATGVPSAAGAPAFPCSDTHPAPFGIHVGEVLGHPGGDQPAAGQPDGDPGTRRGQGRLDLPEADRAAERGRHAAGGHPARDARPVENLARLGRDHGPVLRLQADKTRPAAAFSAACLVLPGELGLAEEVVLVELDGPVQAGAEAAGQPVGVLPDDKVALLQPQDALGLHPERRDPQVAAAVHQRLPDVQPVSGRDVQFVAELAGEPDPPQHAPVHPGHPAGPYLHVAERLVGQVGLFSDP